MEKVSLKQMLNELVNCLLIDKEPPLFLWKRDKADYIQITEVDLLRDRFKTIDDDFCYFEWCLREETEIYRGV